jgi:hypothetical protein
VKNLDSDQWFQDPSHPLRMTESGKLTFSLPSLRGVTDIAIQSSRLWAVLFKETITNTGLLRETNCLYGKLLIIDIKSFTSNSVAMRSNTPILRSQVLPRYARNDRTTDFKWVDDNNVDWIASSLRSSQ